MWKIDKHSLSAFIVEARRLGVTCDEACGLLVDVDRKLILVPVANSARQPGSFLLEKQLIKCALFRAGFHWRQAIGTYHSHPIGFAEPGDSDITGTWDGALMLIADTDSHEVKLWQIKSGVAVPCRWFRV